MLEKFRAKVLNLVCEYFCWMLGDPHFFFRQITSFSDSFHYTKKQKNLYVGSFNYFSYTLQIRPNWYLDTGVRDLEVAFLRLILPDLMTYVAKIYQIGLKICCVKHTQLRYGSSI